MLDRDQIIQLEDQYDTLRWPQSGQSKGDPGEEDAAGSSGKWQAKRPDVGSRTHAGQSAKQRYRGGHSSGSNGPVARDEQPMA